MKDEKIAVKYDPKKNPQGYTVDGAPLNDMTAAEWEKLPEQVQRSVAAAGFYEVTAAAEKAAEAANLSELMAALPGVSSETAGALASAGYDTPDKITAASDEELLAIPGIKEKRLAQIRLALQPEKVPADAPAETDTIEGGDDGL